MRSSESEATLDLRKLDDIEITGSPTAIVSLTVDRGEELLVVAKLCAVGCDGSSTLIATGWKNAQFRGGDYQSEPIQPGIRFKLVIPMGATSFAVPKGDRLRLAISCSDFPRVWPSRDKALIRVFVGGDSGTALHLPLVATDQPIQVEVPVPVLDRACERMPWSVASAPAWIISRDVLENSTSIEFGNSVMLKPPSGSTVHVRHRSVATASRVDPSSSRIDSHAGFEIDLPGGERVEIRAHGRFTLDSLLLEGTALLDNTVVFDGRWGA